MNTRTVLLIALSLFAGHAAAADLNFKNTSMSSIPLQIPGVMNPNLSPMSNSGVTLDKGQKVYFKYKGKKTLLLEITDQQDGDVIIVNELIKARKIELDKG
jgi:hypothetical protein